MINDCFNIEIQIFNNLYFIQTFINYILNLLLYEKQILGSPLN